MDDALETALELFSNLSNGKQKDFICLAAFLASQQ